MNYISQTIVFALALMGTLFKSTKTDGGGKTIYAASGLPVLTTTGRVVVTLLSISFCISLITIWQKNKSEEAASRAQEELKAYNKGIDDTLARVFAKTSELSDEQNKKFQAVLSQQKDTGDKIATGIQSSSELLRNRVESSSTLLSGKIGDSIGLLNHSANSIASLLDPITTVQVELLVLEIPLDDLALTSYRNRIEPSIRQFQATGAMETDHLGCSLGGPGGISIASNSKLLPDRVSERVAYNLLSLASVDIFLFKNSLADSRIQTSSDGEYDVHIPVHRQMNYVKGENDKCTSDEHFELFYDLDGHRAFVRVRQLSFNPRSNADEEVRQRNPLQAYYTTWQKSAGGNISGVPDLPTSQLVVRLGDPEPDPHFTDLDLGGVRNSEANEIISAVQRVREKSKLISLNLMFSGELRLEFTTKEYVPNLFPVARLRRLDKSNPHEVPYYVADLPKSLRSPIR